MDDLYHIGNIDHHLGDWPIHHQPDHGAVGAQSSIINDFMGDSHPHVSAADLEYVARANGWSHGADATGMEHAGHLLDAYGVPNHRVESAGIDQVLGELHSGHKVIVGLNDTHALPQDGPLADFFHKFQERLGLDPHSLVPTRHAVAIKGLDTSDPAHPHVILYDAAHADGPTVTCTLDEFEHAWKGSDFSYVATDSAPGGAVHHHGHHLGSDIVGMVAAAGTYHFTANPAIAVAAGKLTTEVTDALWDKLIQSI